MLPTVIVIAEIAPSNLVNMAYLNCNTIRIAADWPLILQRTIQNRFFDHRLTWYIPLNSLEFKA